MLRRLPRTLPPLLNETLGSYLHRLAHANRLSGEALQTHLVNNIKGAPVTAQQLAVVTGYPVTTLRYAMLELSSPSELARMRVTGRPRPGVRHQRPCRCCAARRGAVWWTSVWTTHEDVVCLEHQRWIGTPFTDGDQPHLARQPDILQANRRHRRLIKRHGREPVRFAIIDATHICEQWRDRDWRDKAFQRRMNIFRDRAPDTPVTGPQVGAATYPEIVALARLLVSPYWRHQAMIDNLADRTPDDAVWRHLHEEITAGRRHWDDIPEPIRIAAAGLLREGPALARFVKEVKRAVNPDYRWNPWPHYRRFDPLVRWLMDEVEIHRRQAPRRFRHLEPEHIDHLLTAASTPTPLTGG
jgi:hypothetical protein